MSGVCGQMPSPHPSAIHPISVLRNNIFSIFPVVATTAVAITVGVIVIENPIFIQSMSVESARTFLGGGRHHIGLSHPFCIHPFTAARRQHHIVRRRGRRGRRSNGRGGVVATGMGGVG